MNTVMCRFKVADTRFEAANMSEVIPPHVPSEGSAPNPIQKRPFTLLDAMILVAALAACFAFARIHLSYATGAPYRLRAWQLAWCWFMLPLAPAHIALRLRKPKINI